MNRYFLHPPLQLLLVTAETNGVVNQKVVETLFNMDVDHSTKSFNKITTTDFPPSYIFTRKVRH